MNNIDVFDRCAAKIFADLYQYFPVPIDLEFAPVSLDIYDQDDSGIEVLNKLEIYGHTINWLISAGYLQVKSLSYETAHEVVLTPKGLEVLKLPSAIKAKGASFGEQIVSSVKSGAVGAAGDIAKAAFTQGLAFIASNA